MAAVDGKPQLIPCAFFPWRFFGSQQIDQSHVKLFAVNSISGKQSNVQKVEIKTNRFADLLESIPEFRTMRNLSPMFHVVDIEETDDGKVLICKDLRTRNFNTTFGKLTVELSGSQIVQEVRWHV